MATSCFSLLASDESFWSSPRDPRPLNTWAVRPFSAVPPSPTASLPQLSLLLLLDVIYSGSAESDKPRFP